MRLSLRTFVSALCLPYIVPVEAFGGRFPRDYNYNVSTSSTTFSSTTVTSSSGINLPLSSTTFSSLSAWHSLVDNSRALTGSASISTSLTTFQSTSGATSQSARSSASSSSSSSSPLPSAIIFMTSSGSDSSTASITLNSSSISVGFLSSESLTSTSLSSRTVSSYITPTAILTTVSTVQTTSSNVTNSRIPSVSASTIVSLLSKQIIDLTNSSQLSGLRTPISSKHSNEPVPSGFISPASYNSSQHEASKGFAFGLSAPWQQPTGTGDPSARLAIPTINGTRGAHEWSTVLGVNKPVHHLTSDGVLGDGEGLRIPFPSSPTPLTVSPPKQMQPNADAGVFTSLMTEASTETGRDNAVASKAVTSETSLAAAKVVPNVNAAPVAGHLPSSNTQVAPTAVQQQQNPQPTSQQAGNASPGTPSEPAVVPDVSGLGNLAIGLLSAVASNAAASPATQINTPGNFVTPTVVQQQPTAQPASQQAGQVGGISPTSEQAGAKDGQDSKPFGPAVVVQSQIVPQGGPPVIINGNTVAYSSGSIYVGASAGPAPVPQQQANPVPNPAPITVSGFQFTPIQISSQAVTAAPAVVVQGQTLFQNAPPVSISGVPLAYSAGSVYAGSSVAPVTPFTPQQQQYNPAPNPVALGNFQFTPVPQQGNSNGGAAPAVVVQGQTLAQNAPPVSISGVPLAYSAGSIFVGTNAAPVPTIPPQKPINFNAPGPIAVGGYTFVPTQPQGAEAAVIVQGQTLTANGAPITISGTPLAYSAGSVFVGSSGMPLPSVVPQQLNAIAPAPITVEGFTFVPTQPLSQGGAAAPAVIVQGQTLTANGAPITISGTPLAYSAGSVYVGSSGMPVPTTPPTTPQQNVPPAVIGGLTFYPAQASANLPVNVPIATVAGQVITQGPAGVVAIGGQTLTPGGSPVTISGTPVSLGSSILVAGGSTIQLPVPTQPSSIYTVGGQIFTVNPSGFAVGSTTLKPGSAITISGTPISIATSNGANALVIGSSTVPLPTANPLPTLTIGGQTITANSASQFIAAGQTLVPGGSAIIVSGTPISLAPSASALVVDASTQILATKTLPTLTIGDQIITANSASQYTVAGQTLIPGGNAITLSGTPISLAPSASALIIGTNTQTLATKVALPTLTIGGQVVTANSASQYVIAGQTLVPGGNAITISGTPLSLAPSATQLIVGTSTIPLATSLPTLTIGGQAITANSTSQYIIAGQTLVPGGDAITVSGTLISLAPSESLLVVGTSTQTLAGQSIGLGGAMLSGLGGGSSGFVTPTGSITYASASATKAAGSGGCKRLGASLWLMGLWGFGAGFIVLFGL